MDMQFTKTSLKMICTLAVLCSATLLVGCGQGDSVEEKVAAARKRNDGPAIWKVTDQDSTVYLYGSVHLLPDGAKWQRRDMKAAFDEVGTVFFEIPDNDRANLEATILQQQYGVYESGDRLSNHLDSLAHKQLTAAAYNVGLAPDRLNMYKPWLASDILAIAVAEQNGLFAKNSVDTALRAQAVSAKKSIRALDDMRTYIEAVALQSDELQLASLKETISDFDTLAFDIKTINATWIVGDIERLEHDMLDPAKEKSPEMFAALFTERNAKWSEKLDQFLQGNENAMVVVGIGHLLGTDGLPARLEEMGYAVERVRRYDLPND